MHRRRFLTRLLATTILAGSGCSRRSGVTLYCAQDREFAESLLADYTQSTGIEVRTKFDTEANKSVGIIEELLRERNRPRCDVHWNNEILGTLRLQAAGILEPYASPQGTPFPDWTRPQDQTWQAFAARARVIIVNTTMVPMADRPTSIFDLTNIRWKGQVALAKPQFGTTATHAACLFSVLGTDIAEKFYRSLAVNEVQLVAGNKQVAQQVAAGRYALGMTDSDDALIEVLAKKPVTLIYPDRNGGTADHPKLGTLFIPNTLALIRGGPNPDAGRALIDFLLRPETEARLATGGGYQIPLNPNVDANLIGGLETPKTVQPMQVDFMDAADRWDAVQAFLRAVFAG